VRLIATDYYGPAEAGQPARMRAYAGFDAEALAAVEAARPFDLLGQGVFAIMIDQGAGTVPYQGVTPIAGGSLADCAETYFAQSEQLPTRFALAMGEAVEPGGAAHWRGGGVLLQHMPKGSLEARQGATGFDGLLAAEDMLEGADAENWRRAVTLLETVEATELIGPHVGAEQLLLRLFNEEGPRVYAPQPVRFGCTCAPEKVVRSLAAYPASEIAGMTTPDM
jgi:molecular chaperone Hsp33